MAKSKGKKDKRRHGMRKHSIVEAAGAALTAYQAGKVGYGNFSWLDNVKENPTQFALNFVGFGEGGFNLSNLVAVDGPVAVSYIAEKVLHKLGLDFKVSKRWKA